MYVIKRDGRQETVHFEKITSRIKRLCYGLSERVEPILIAQKVCMGVYKGVTTVELDELAAETAAGMTTEHPDYGQLSARIAISNLHKQTLKSFSETAKLLYNNVEPRTGERAPLLSDETYAIIMEHAAELDSAVIYARDYGYDFFGYRTLEKSYLMKINGKVVERPQHMLMRVAIGIHGRNIADALAAYELMSQKFFTHASPTLFNAGTPRPQMSSCFLVCMKDDSIEGIYDTLKSCALISKNSGGIGMSIHNIRAGGSYIRGTNGVSNGLIPLLRVFNTSARFVSQGGGKRNGSIAIYLEPWHADIGVFLDLKKNHGAEEMRARDLFYALWVPDLFMERVEANADWSLFCPNEAPGLGDTWGDEFNALYRQYEAAGKAREVVKARALWQSIVKAQMETGTPFLCFKDAANRKSNQQNLGTIRSSNLCTEIMEFSSPEETAVCNLASISLPLMVQDGKFSHERLVDVVRVITLSLNRVIDGNFYPIKEARTSNMRHRPIGIGVQGLADLFMMLRLPFESEAAAQLNREVFETIYFAALTESCRLAKELGHYETYPGSPVSKGILQFDMWGVTPSDRWDWAGLRRDIAAYGVRNSLLVAPMPTAATSQILGNNECFEPYTSNLYLRRTMAGEFVVVNQWLMKDLMRLGLWNKRMRNRLLAANGSVQGIKEIPEEVRALYKTVWEIKQKTLIDLAADRGAFIDQSQSFNVFMAQPDFGRLTSLHFYAWKKGLKTGMYYLRTAPAADAIKFTVDQQLLAQTVDDKDEATAADKDGVHPPAPLVRAESGLEPLAMRKSMSVASEVASSAGSPGTPTRESPDHTQAVIACSLENRDECISCGS